MAAYYPQDTGTTDMPYDDGFSTDTITVSSGDRRICTYSVTLTSEEPYQPQEKPMVSPKQMKWEQSRISVRELPAVHTKPITKCLSRPKAPIKHGRQSSWTGRNYRKVR